MEDLNNIMNQLDLIHDYLKYEDNSPENMLFFLP